MPFALTDEEKNPTQGQQTAAPNISGPSGTAVNVPGQTAAAGPKVSGPRKSGQYQNIQKYLAANAPQGEAIGQKVSGVVEKEVGEAQQAGQTLGGQVQKVEAYDPTKVLGNLPQATEEEKKTYQSTKQTGGYTGPSDVTGLGGYGAFQTEKGQAETTLGQAGTETGQRELVKTAYARPTYSTGQQTLDVSLLGQSAGGKQAIQDITQKYQPLVQALGGVTEQAQTGIESARQQAAQNVAAFSPAEQQAQASILSPIEQRVKSEEEKAGRYDQYLADLEDLNLNTQTLQALGLTPGQQIWTPNLGQFVQAPTEAASVQNLATADERQKYNDLMNFLNQNNQAIGLGEPTYQGISFNKEQFEQEQKQRETEFYKLASEEGFGKDFFEKPTSFKEGQVVPDRAISWSGSGGFGFNWPQGKPMTTDYILGELNSFSDPNDPRQQKLIQGFNINTLIDLKNEADAISSGEKPYPSEFYNRNPQYYKNIAANASNTINLYLDKYYKPTQQRIIQQQGEA